jgi:hypothetical protein
LCGETGEYLYDELWKLCAGPLVDVPQAQERVYYFPQGHMEQLEASTQQVDLNTMKPLFVLPPKILCNVMNVSLQVYFPHLAKPNLSDDVSSIS